MVVDIIFFVYVYQCWVYLVDKKCVNEFGFGGVDEKVLEVGVGFLEGMEVVVQGVRVGEDRVDVFRVGIMEDFVSKIVVGIRSGKDSSVVLVGLMFIKEDKKNFQLFVFFFLFLFIFVIKYIIFFGFI